MLLSSDVQYVNVQYSKQGSSRLFLMQWTSLYCTLLESGGHGDRFIGNNSFSLQLTAWKLSIHNADRYSCLYVRLLAVD